MAPPFNISKNPAAAKAAALQAAREKAASAPTAADGVLQKWSSPAEAKDRIRILFDDSGSMSSQIAAAKEGVTEFFRNCIPNQTAVAVHMLCMRSEKLEALNSNLIEAAAVLKDTPARLGNTPLFRTFREAASAEPIATRFVLFTDGEPDHEEPYNWQEPEQILCNKDADKLIARAKELSAPVDTVFYGPEQYHEDNIKLLKYIADGTGGYFLHFDPKKVNFRTAFKYLAPVNRFMLASESVRKEIESGARS